MESEKDVIAEIAYAKLSQDCPRGKWRNVCDGAQVGIALATSYWNHRNMCETSGDFEKAEASTSRLMPMLEARMLDCTLPACLGSQADMKPYLESIARTIE